MAFFARPNLDNLQFKQLPGGEPLTLSGQTQIATTSGLTLTDGAGGNIPITATGATQLDVLTYKDGVISLEPSSASGGQNYSGATPSSCEVGGMVVDTILTGRTLSSILEEILVPTLDPVLSNPTISSFVIAPTTLLYEVGCSIAIGQTTVLNPGSINPQYTSASSCRSNGADYYRYGNKGIYSCVAAVPPTAPSDSTPFGTICITSGNNQLSSQIYYLCGVQPKDSSGGDYSTPLVSGCTAASTKNICGIYPWYWGTDSVAPDVSTSGCTQCLIDSYDGKCIGSSVNNITVDNFNVTGEYIWFAIPTGNTKANWQGANNVSNNGVIPGGLFPVPTSMLITSPDSCWGPTASPPTPLQGYEIYVSNYATAINYGMTFSN